MVFYWNWKSIPQKINDCLHVKSITISLNLYWLVSIPYEARGVASEYTEVRSHSGSHVRNGALGFGYGTILGILFVNIYMVSRYVH